MEKTARFALAGRKEAVAETRVEAGMKMKSDGGSRGRIKHDGQ